MGKVKVGMGEEQVVKMLGLPDDVRPTNFRGWRKDPAPVEIWCYGTDGYMTFPTLGRVYFGANRKVQQVCGGTGKPPPPTFLAEPVLRNALQIIDRLPSFNEHDPRRTIQAVNVLQRLGENRALAAVDEYLRVVPEESDAREGLFAVLRVLLDVPLDPGYMPIVTTGFSPPHPDDPKLIPLFPIVLVDDVPLMAASHSRHSGPPLRVEKHVDYFRTHGQLRARPLAPTDRPLSLLSKYAATTAWRYGLEHESTPWHCSSGDDRCARARIAEQVLRLVASVYQAEIEDCCDYQVFDPDNVDRRWREVQAAFGSLDVHWDAARDDYAFKDGSRLSEVPWARPREQTWRIPLTPLNATFAVQRRSKRCIDLIVESWASAGATSLPVVILRVYPVRDPEETLLNIGIPDATPPGNVTYLSTGDTSGTFLSVPCELPAGEELKVEVTSQGQSVVGPVFRP